MENYGCAVFGYIEYAERGNPNSGIKPGLPLEDLPEVCVWSECGAGKEKFEKED